jgi:hypothetical protein
LNARPSWLLKRFAPALLCLAAVLVLTAFADKAHGCDRPQIYTLTPSPDAVRISGVIAGYGAPRPVGLLIDAPTLQVRVQEVISGNIREVDAEAALLNYGADCRSTPEERQTLERMFPVGTPIVVLGVARVRGGTAIIVVETNSSNYVVRIPQSVIRTSYGDVDFQRFDARDAFGDFEFARVILTLPNTAVADRAARLRNLAYYHWFRGMPNAGEFYTKIVSNGGVSQAEGRALREHFDQLHLKQ